MEVSGKTFSRRHLKVKLLPASRRGWMAAWLCWAEEQAGTGKSVSQNGFLGLKPLLIMQIYEFPLQNLWRKYHDGKMVASCKLGRYL